MPCTRLPRRFCAPGRLLQYLLDNMLAGYEQDDDVTVLVMHVPAGTVSDEGSPDQQWAER